MGILLRNVVAIPKASKTARTIDLRIEEATISAISEERLPVHSGETIVDGEGKLAVPGFVNAHTHLPMTLFRGLADDLPLHVWLEKHIWPLERRLEPQEIYWGSLLGLSEMIRSGTTLCADMYFHTDTIGRAVEEAGVRAVLSCGIIAERLDAHGEAELKKAEEAIVQWEGAADGRIKTAVSPHAVYTCGEAVWRAAIELAQDHAVPLHTHLAETDEEIAWSQEHLGVSPVAFLSRIGAFSVPFLAAHCVHVDKEDIALLARENAVVVHCPKSNAKLGNGIAPISALRKDGVKIALGTDGAATNNSLDMIEEMRMASLLGKVVSNDPTVLPAQEVVKMATQIGAEALGTGTKSIAVGEPADIVLVDLGSVHTLPTYNPFSSLVYAGHTQDVTDVIVAGRFLLRDRELLTIDEERVKYEVKKLVTKYKN
jgi:5-methylthioadenosine/S-adenosylhomocysteine deaminase